MEGSPLPAPTEPRDTRARLDAAAEMDDRERVKVLDEVYAALEADLERESPGA